MKNKISRRSFLQGIGAGAAGLTAAMALGTPAFAAWPFQTAAEEPSKYPKKALFIGNSLLYGFGSFGMCASSAEHDYYYHVTSYLKAQEPSFTADRAFGVPLEKAENDAAQDDAYNKIANKLSSDLELVVVQLSDNTNNDNSIAYLKNGGAKRLLTKLHAACPKATIAWVAAWYSSQEKQEAIRQACEETGSVFVDISDLRTGENRGAVGNVITYPDGSTSVVTDAGAAGHPGDLGMLRIAERICYTLGYTDAETALEG